MNKWSQLIFSDSADCCLVILGSSDVFAMHNLSVTKNEKLCHYQNPITSLQ